MSASTAMSIGNPADALSDEQFALQAQGGCSSSLAALTERMRPRLVHFLARSVGSVEQAEDLAHDALARAIEKLDQYDGRSRFSTWLFTIGRRLAIDEHRKRKPEVGLKLTEPMATEEPAPLDRLASREATEGLWALAMRELSGPAYEAMWLRYGEDMTVAEVARVLGRSVVWVRVTLMRARRKLLAAMPGGV